MLKNCCVNDGGVLKSYAVECFTEDFDLHIEQGKMTVERKFELLEKIKKIVNNDATAFAGVESNINVAKDSNNGDIVIDMIASIMKTDKDDPEAMNMSYAASKSVIKDANKA